MDNKIILISILLIGLLLRIWEMNFPVGLWSDGTFACSIMGLNFQTDFFEALKTNCYAPLHCYYIKLWSLLFKDSSLMLKLSALIPNLAACLVMYFVGKNYQTKKHSINIGLAAAAISAISSFLIYFAFEAKMYSMIFLLSSLVLLFSIKMYEYPCKKNAGYLTLFSILLVLYHTIGFVFVLFNIFGLIAFRPRKKKETDIYMPIMAGLILVLPLIPFIFRIFAHPTYISQWWSPFNWSNIFFFLTDFFSPVLKNLVTLPTDFYHQLFKADSINIGFLMFAITPAAIALVLIIKSNIESKRINKYFLAVFLATFLTVLIAAITTKLSFLTKYLIELYPLTILMAAIGWAQLNSKNNKIALATIYIFIQFFFIIVTHLTNVQLLG